MMKKPSTLDYDRWIEMMCRLLAILHGHASIDDLVEKQKQKQKQKNKNLKNQNTDAEEEPESTEQSPEQSTEQSSSNLSEVDLLMNEFLSMIKQSEHDEGNQDNEDIGGNEEDQSNPKSPFFCYTCGSCDHNQDTCPESWRVIEHIDERMKETSNEQQQEQQREEEEEESIAEKNEDLLLSWTSQPSEEDVIVHAIPVCAPYAVLADYRYHVKLTAGKMKKGAIAKSVIEAWLKEKLMDSERRVIKAMTNDDMVTVIMNNSKVIISNTKGKK